MMKFVIVLAFYFTVTVASGQPVTVKFYPVDSGWAANSVNAVVFRKNALVTSGKWQFISYYDANGNVVLGKRKHGKRRWTLYNTGLKGNVRDAHNSISIMVDGKGFLHLAWNHHNNMLHYRRSLAPLSLEMADSTPMIGRNEDRVSYPEFYRMPDGGLLFLYRDGGSGGGNLVINRFDAGKGRWSRVSGNVIDGEGQRNAYWQCYLDIKGVFHISWVWRESPDVASNHDLCYARTRDGGVTWERSDGTVYNLPINASNAEYVLRILQGSELINQTSMTADEGGHPVIASYWRDAGDSVPQYHVVSKTISGWQVDNAGFRKTTFTLTGAGTKQIPVSRPQVISWKKKRRQYIALVFRDAERGNKVSVAVGTPTTRNDGTKHASVDSATGKNEKRSWAVFDLDAGEVDAWEPSYDTELWKSRRLLHLFVQRVAQADSEGLTSSLPQPVTVIGWKP